jgi:hypothetical protein
MSVISPSYSSGTLEDSLFIQTGQIEGFLSLLRDSHRVSQFSWPLLGLALLSYHVRELFICWLFFTGMFVVLALLISAGMLGWYGWKRAFYWMTPLGENSTSSSVGSTCIPPGAGVAGQKAEMTLIR